MSRPAPAGTRPLATAGGLVIHDRGGDRDPVLWIHGYAMDSTVWDPVWPLLPGHRHVGLDLPGHGWSRALRPGEDLHTVAGCVADAAEQVGARRIVALSFGTLAALQAAIDRPAAFDALVLAAPGLAGGPQEAAVERRYLDLADLYRRSGPGPHMTDLWLAAPPDVFRYAARQPELIACLAAAADRHSWAELAATGTQALTAGSQDPDALAGLRASTLVLVGENELPAHRSCARIVAGAAPCASVATLEGAGHLALLERPGPAAEAILRHLSREPSARAR